MFKKGEMGEFPGLVLFLALFFSKISQKINVRGVTVWDSLLYYICYIIIIAMSFDVCGGRFYNNFDVWKLFFRQKKNDTDIEDFYFLCCIMAKLVRTRVGKARLSDIRAKRFLLVHLLKSESDIKEGHQRT